MIPAITGIAIAVSQASACARCAAVTINAFRRSRGDRSMLLLVGFKHSTKFQYFFIVDVHVISPPSPDLTETA
jgi:hypothetical protein